MCGIFTSISSTDQRSLAEISEEVEQALGKLAHRGPDALGVEVQTLPWGTVGIGMARLKIVDQRDLHVPYTFFESHGVILAFNGEIYNWRDLRQEIGGEWSTECDAEVVAAAWRRWGVACLERFNGMWGIVLLDLRCNKVFIARDRAGEKPIYYAQQGKALYVTSEIKALPIEFEECECLDRECLEFDCGTDTPVKGVHTLRPGHFILLEAAEDVTDSVQKCWWELPRSTLGGLSERLDELVWLLKDAISIRYAAEVPVAIQFSGGLDSAIIQAVCRSDKLYCVDFPLDAVDNLSMARVGAQGYQVTPISFTREDLFQALPDVVYHLDTPATWTAVCQWFLNRRVAQDGNVIVLSGEGADELFWGYSRYRVLWWYSKLLADPHLEAYRPLISRTFGGDLLDVQARMLDRSGGAQLEHARSLITRYRGQLEETQLVEAMARVDFYTTMQVLLRMADRMASAFSLENRSPFFDYRIMEFAARLPATEKITKKWSKALLRKAALVLGVPEAIVTEKTKKGLFVPPSWGSGGNWSRSWFRDAMGRAWIDQVINRGRHV